MKFILYLFFCLLIVSCSNSDESSTNNSTTTNNNTSGNPTPPNISIAPEFREHVQRFIEEMQQRGRNLSATNLSVLFVDEITAAPNSTFCAYGYPNYKGTGRPAIEVLNTYECWGKWNITQKENLLFHELGHALLTKGHDNRIMPNNMSKSLMCSSDICNNYRAYNIFQTAQRAYYLDQLLHPNISTPEWAEEKLFSQVLFEDTFDEGIEYWNFEIIDDTSPITSYEFYLEETNTTSPPYSLGISATNTANGIAYGYWFRDFEVEVYEDCANILVYSDIITKDATNAFVGFYLDYMITNELGELESIDRHYTLLENIPDGISTYNDMLIISDCITQEVEKVRVYFILSAADESAIYLDNLSIQLYE